MSWTVMFARYIEVKTIRWKRRIERIKNLDGEMDVLNCYVQPNTLKRKPFGEKEELKELKIWMVWNIMFMFWITMDVVNCYVQRNTL